MYNYYKTEKSVIRVHAKHNDRLVAAGFDIMTEIVDHYRVDTLTEIDADEAMQELAKCYANGVQNLAKAFLKPLTITAVENLDFLIYGHLSTVYEPNEDVTRVGYVSNHYIEDDILYVTFIDMVNGLKIEYCINHEVLTTPKLTVHAPLLNLDSDVQLVQCYPELDSRLGLKNNQRKLLAIYKDGEYRELLSGRKLNPFKKDVVEVLPHNIITSVTDMYVARVYAHNSGRLAGIMITPELVKEKDLVGTFVGFTGEYQPEKTSSFDTPVKCTTYMGYVKKTVVKNDITHLTLKDVITHLDITIPVEPGVFLVM